MEKRGQVAIFVIVAIIIVAAIVVYFTVFNQNKGKREVATEIAPINAYVRGCLKQTAIDALYVTGQYGGYYNETYFDTEEVVYYTSANKLQAPSESAVEAQISNYIGSNIGKCFGNFSQFTGFQVAVGAKQVTTSIANESIDVSYKPAIVITKGKTTYELNNFEQKVDTSLGLMYNVATKLAQDYILLGGINIAYGSAVNDDYNITFNSIDYADYTSIHIRDEKGANGESPLEFVFALK